MLLLSPVVVGVRVRVGTGVGLIIVVAVAVAVVALVVIVRSSTSGMASLWIILKSYKHWIHKRLGFFGHACADSKAGS